VSRSFELLLLASRSDDPQCSIKLQDFFPNTDMERLLQPSGRRGFPSRRAHPLGKYRNSNPDVRTPVSMVWTRVYQIWKLRASDQPSGRQFPRSGCAMPLYGNCLQRTCDCPDDKASPSGRGSQTGKIFSEIFGISVAQLSVRTAYDHRPDDAQFYLARRLFELLAYK
jgi:hypothetical protein